MNQHADAGDKEQPYAGKRVEQKTGVGLKERLCPVMRRVGHVAGVGADPGVENGLVGLVEMLIA